MSVNVEELTPKQLEALAVAAAVIEKDLTDDIVAKIINDQITKDVDKDVYFNDTTNEFLYVDEKTPVEDKTFKRIGTIGAIDVSTMLDVKIWNAIDRLQTIYEVDDGEANFDRASVTATLGYKAKRTFIDSSFYDETVFNEYLNKKAYDESWYSAMMKIALPEKKILDSLK